MSRTISPTVSVSTRIARGPIMGRLYFVETEPSVLTLTESGAGAVQWAEVEPGIWQIAPTEGDPQNMTIRRFGDTAILVDA